MLHFARFMFLYIVSWVLLYAGHLFYVAAVFGVVACWFCHHNTDAASIRGAHRLHRWPTAYTVGRNHSQHWLGFINRLADERLGPQLPTYRLRFMSVLLAMSLSRTNLNNNYL